MRLVVAAFACALLVSGPSARADWGVTFVRPTCVGSIRLFSVETFDLTNIDELYLLDSEDRLRAADTIVKEGNLYLDDLPVSIDCRFHDGTVINFRTVPNGGDERHVFPGSSLTLTINGRVVLGNVGLNTDCVRTVFGLSIEPDGGEFVVVGMGRSSALHPVGPDNEINKLPTSFRVPFDKPYDTKNDPMLIGNCY